MTDFLTHIGDWNLNASKAAVVGAALVPGMMFGAFIHTRRHQDDEGPSGFSLLVGGTKSMATSAMTEPFAFFPQQESTRSALSIAAVYRVAPRPLYVETLENEQVAEP